jgi:hypothetical protein
LAQQQNLTQLGHKLVLRLRVEVAGVVALVPLARRKAVDHVPALTPAGSPIMSAHRWTFLLAIVGSHTPIDEPLAPIGVFLLLTTNILRRSPAQTLALADVENALRGSSRDGGGAAA